MAEDRGVEALQRVEVEREHGEEGDGVRADIAPAHVAEEGEGGLVPAGARVSGDEGGPGDDGEFEGDLVEEASSGEEGAGGGVEVEDGGGDEGVGGGMAEEESVKVKRQPEGVKSGGGGAGAEERREGPGRRRQAAGEQRPIVGEECVDSGAAATWSHRMIRIRRMKRNPIRL